MNDLSVRLSLINTNHFKEEIVMKKILFIFMAILLIGVLALSGCSKSTSTTTTSPAATTTTSAAPPPSSSATATPTASPTAQVHTGGTLRIICGTIPKDLGYPPEYAPNDSYQELPVIERLCQWGDNKGNLEPVLATSWDQDQSAKTITWHIRQGVKFTDGTPLNAQAVAWNFQLELTTSAISGGNFVKSLEVKDDNTLVLHMTRLDWTMVEDLGLLQCISPTAFLTAGGTIPSGSDNATEVAWARTHVVGTGPFTVSDWVRDDHITWVKNPNYWQPGKPYLDKIIMREITDTTVASAALQNGEADEWMDMASVTEAQTLQTKGFKFVQGPGYWQGLLYSDVDPTSPLHNVLVREAIEYAIDRPTLAKTLGQNLYESLTQMVTSVSPAYIPGYNPRPYDSAKAKDLLTQAGYSNGFTIKMLAMSGGNTNDAMALFQYDLGLVNIKVQPDLADIGRYFGAIFGGVHGGWDGLCFTASGINPDASDLYVHFGPNPMTFATPNLLKTDAFTQACNAGLDPSITNASQALPAITAAYKQCEEDALFCPLFRSYEATWVWSYVHTDYPTIHGIIWHCATDWMDAH